MANQNKDRTGRMAQGRVPAKLHQAFQAVIDADGYKAQAGMAGALYLFINASERSRLVAVRKGQGVRNGSE